LDKFLWIGFIVMAFGVYQMAVSSFANGLIWFGAGVAFEWRYQRSGAELRHWFAIYSY